MRRRCHSYFVVGSALAFALLLSGSFVSVHAQSETTPVAVPVADGAVPAADAQPVATDTSPVPPAGIHPSGAGPVLLSSAPGVVYQLGPDGAATFYSSVTPFRGVAISQDGHNLYIGN
jgi:hypothetical protein